jgi:hypothetical protein
MMNSHDQLVREIAELQKLMDQYQDTKDWKTQWEYALLGTALELHRSILSESGMC